MTVSAMVISISSGIAVASCPDASPHAARLSRPQSLLGEVGQRLHLLAARALLGDSCRQRKERRAGRDDAGHRAHGGGVTRSVLNAGAITSRAATLAASSARTLECPCGLVVT